MTQNDRDAIYDLPDDKLVIAAALIRSRAEALQLPLSAWAMKFCRDVCEAYTRKPHISWKQRKKLREIVIEMTGLLRHRAEFTAELGEALQEVRG